jgi:hypothetical protein
MTTPTCLEMAAKLHDIADEMDQHVHSEYLAYGNAPRTESPKNRSRQDG